MNKVLIKYYAKLVHKHHYELGDIPDELCDQVKDCIKEMFPEDETTNVSGESHDDDMN